MLRLIPIVGISVLLVRSIALECIQFDSFEECLDHMLPTEGHMGCRWDSSVGCFDFGCPTVTNEEICGEIPKEMMDCEFMELEFPESTFIAEEYFTAQSIGEPKVCMGACPQKVDLIFLVDVALSNGEDGKHLQNSIIRAVDQSFQVSQKRNSFGKYDEGTEFSLISFGKNGVPAKVEFGFGEYETDGEYYAAIKESIPLESNEASSDYREALVKANELFENARENAEKIIILLSENIPISSGKPCANGPSLVDEFAMRGIEVYVVLTGSITPEEADVECFVEEKVGRAVTVDDFALDLFTYPLAYAMSQSTCEKPTFHFVEKSMLWSDANEYCLATYGSTLATIRNEEEELVAESLCVRLSHPSTKCWIGYNDVRTEGEFEWIDGADMTYSEPFYRRSVIKSAWGDCGFLKSNRDYSGHAKWRVGNCAKWYMPAFLCNVCPPATKACPDGSQVTRDPQNRCQFRECPTSRRIRRLLN